MKKYLTAVIAILCLAVTVIACNNGGDKGKLVEIKSVETAEKKIDNCKDSGTIFLALCVEESSCANCRNLNKWLTEDDEFNGENLVKSNPGVKFYRFIKDYMSTEICDKWDSYAEQASEKGSSTPIIIIFKDKEIVSHTHAPTRQEIQTMLDGAV